MLQNTSIFKSFVKLHDICTCNGRKIQVHENSYQSQMGVGVCLGGGFGGDGRWVGINFIH